MAEASWPQSEISLAALMDIVRRNRWRIARWAAAGALLFGGVAFMRPPVYQANASFVPQGSEPAQSGLAGIAGQLGVTLNGSNQTLSPEFYRRLLQSRVLLDPVARDTFTVPELGKKQVTFLDLFKIPGGSPDRRLERGVVTLRQLVLVGVEKSTGVVQLTVTTRWPSVSLAIATRLVNGVSDYNEHIRQTQAAAERKFIEGRLALAGSDLRAAEDRLADFLKTNRQFGGSAELSFQRERLQRDVSLKQDVFTSLTQGYEDARVREVRDTPVITIFEPPAVSTLPEPRHRVQLTVLGLLLGFVVGTLLAFASAVFKREAIPESVDEEAAATIPHPKPASVAQRKWLGRTLT